MIKEEKNLFKIDEKLINQYADGVLGFVKKQYKFFFGFFLGVLVVLLLN